MPERYPQEFGNYRLLRKLSQGGMAEIFLAQNHKGEISAIKRILPHLAHQEGFIRMFIDEARIVAQLDHPNIAGTHEQSKVDGFYYIAMEYVAGHSLLAVADRAVKMRMALPRGLLGYIVAELLAALGHAHSARDSQGRHLGIVHRDVTPQNVMISYDGEVKLIDFGVAKARARLTQTEAGFTKGKLSYMSPEQARGEVLDGRSDLFSAGIILYEITTGRRLFNKEGPGGVLSAIVNEPIPRPSKYDKRYPKELERIVMKALEKDVRNRWQTAEDMRDALLRFGARERPRPGQARLKDLVHDLFGASEHQSVIDRAHADRQESSPTNVAVSEAPPPELEIAPSETRAFEPSRPVPALSLADETDRASESVLAARAEPASESAVNLSVEASIPVPELPFRVRLAKWLEGIGRALTAHWRRHVGRYRKASLALGVVGLLGLAWAAGLHEMVGRWMGNVAEDARDFRAKAGLDNQGLDATVRPTNLVMHSQPPGAIVSIDGVGAGCVTPCTLDEPIVGRPIEIELRLGGYRPFQDRVTLYPNEGERRLDVDLEQQTGALKIETTPSGASVRVNGVKRRGRTPLVVDGLIAGKAVAVEVRYRDLKPQTRVAFVEDGKTNEVEFRFRLPAKKVPPARLEIVSQPSGCRVTLGGVDIGTTPLARYEVRAGAHLIAVHCEHHTPEMRTAIVRTGETRTVSVRPRPSTFGYLSLDIIPADGTTVTVNGQTIATPVRFQKLVPGRHAVTLENVGIRKKTTFYLEVGPNQRIRRQVNLLTK